MNVKILVLFNGIVSIEIVRRIEKILKALLPDAIIDHVACANSGKGDGWDSLLFRINQDYADRAIEIIKKIEGVADATEEKIVEPKNM